MSLAAVALLISLCTVTTAAPTDRLVARAVCGGETSLSQCGGSYPSDFCCPQSTTCVSLSVTGAVATICCPTGGNCSTIALTTCDQSAYNATIAASNQIHVAPMIAPITCGTQCCPPGYTCQNGTSCVAVIAAAANSPSSTTTSSTSTPTTNGATVVASTTDVSPYSPSFSGSSFAAGLVPGIVLGMLILAVAGWLFYRRRRQIYNEKSDSSDQLTATHRPATHKRSISGPSLPSDDYTRTDFLRIPPPSHDDVYLTSSIDTIDEEHTSSSNQSDERRPMYEFVPSPIPSQSPLPAHLKRGTLTYSVSPIRQLRTKKSIRSLRRAATSPVDHERKSMSRSNTSASTDTTGTIKLMMTPDQRPSYVAPQPTRSPSPVPSSIYPQTWTPTRPSHTPQQGMLGSPYMYQPRGDHAHDHLEVPARDKRVTTFSTLMEKAGLNKEDFLSKD